MKKPTNRSHPVPRLLTLFKCIHRAHEKGVAHSTERIVQLLKNQQLRCLYLRSHILVTFLGVAPNERAIIIFTENNLLSHDMSCVSATLYHASEKNMYINMYIYIYI